MSRYDYRHLKEAIKAKEYTVTIMDRSTYEVKDTFQTDITSCTIKMDYLNPASFPMTLKGGRSLNIAVNDWIRIERYNWPIFDGYIQGIQISDNKTIINISSPLRLLDDKAPMLYLNDYTGYATWIIRMMHMLYYSIDPSQHLAYIKPISFGYTSMSSNVWDNLTVDFSENYDGSLMESIINIRKNYGCFVHLYFNADSLVKNRLNLYIKEKDSLATVIDAESVDVHKVSIKKTSKTGNNVAKIFAYDSEEGRGTIYYHTMVLKDDGTIGRTRQDVYDLENPVVSSKIVAIDKFPSTYPEEELIKILNPSSDSIEIRLTYGVNSSIWGLNNWYPELPSRCHIGNKYTIKYKGTSYETYLTGVEFDKDEITWIFGFVRPELTKALS